MMANNLDPKMQAIIDNTVGRDNAAEVFHPSQFSHHFHHGATAYKAPLASHLSHQINQRAPSNQSIPLTYRRSEDNDGRPPRFAPLDQPHRDPDLDEFDRQLLHGFEPSSQPHMGQNTSQRLSMPFSSDMSTAMSSQPLTHDFQQRRPVGQLPSFRDLRAGTNSGHGLQHFRMSLPGPSRLPDIGTLFHPVPATKSPPALPFRLDHFVYNLQTEKGAEQKQQSSSPITGSSPTQKVSLRRTANRPNASRTMIRNVVEASTTRSEKPVHSLTVVKPQRQDFSTGRVHAPPTVLGIQLISPHELPDRFRQVFPYPLFNPVQSKCFGLVYKSTDNVVISAPTGSGKTALLELAICKLVEDYSLGQFKIVYQAPTKSLCAERVRDWQIKFSHLNLPCAELTGDTDAAEMKTVGNATIIVTTPEKWDSVTRKWKDHVKLLQMVKLFLIDEVHILKDIRGATLEAVVSRMKSIGAQVRFVALSATVPNSQDIAVWLGRDHANGDVPARRETFGEEFRPVVLEKHVYGFDNSGNDFAFDSFLDSKLPNLVTKHARGKPMMIFCFTRKSCETTAAKLAEWWAKCRITDRAWPQPERTVAVGNKALQGLITRGVAFHHAGLDSEDRLAVETEYLKGGISVICCTSTLAVGVNLPCHLVVIKNTVGYQDAGLVEYSDLELMQMLGRAGRPQFDKEAVGVIVTRSNKIDRYKKMISGQEVIESTLHRNLIEHLNSEIGLGTVRDIYTAKRWLAGTFLSVRVKQNPTYYRFDCDDGPRDAEERLEKVGERDIKRLQEAKLITMDERFDCTGYGLAMSKYMVAFETIKLLLSIPKHAKIGQMMHIICQAAEFKDLRLKATERAIFRAFNTSSFIKFPIKENITTSAHKVSLIIQVQLGGVDLPSDKDFNAIRKQYQAEKSIVFDRIQRLVKCVVECKADDCDGFATGNALELSRSIAAGFWENSSLQLRQIEGIGPAALRKLVISNIRSVEMLGTLDSADIERIMSRNPPHGTKILASVSMFPQLSLKVKITKRILKAGFPVKVQVRAEVIGLARTLFWRNRPISVTFFAALSTGELRHIWRGSIRKLSKAFDIIFICELSGPTDAITCQVACDDIVGTAQSVILIPGIPASEFPVKLDLKSVTGDDDSYWNDAEFLAVVNTFDGVVPKSTLKQPDSDYGDDIDGFMDVDCFDIEPQQDVLEAQAQPVKMENGRWQCNHACRGGKTKRGVPCKHDCCHNGLPKPRKLQPPKTAVGKNEGKNSKLKSSSTKLTLRDPRDPINFDDVEEIDLAGESPPPSHAEVALEEDRKLHDLHSKIPGLESNRLLKQKDALSYKNGSRLNLDFFDLNDDQYAFLENDDEFPDELLEMVELDDYNAMGESNFVDTSSQYDDAFTLPHTTPSEPTETFTDEAFDYGAFLGLESSSSEQSQVAKRSLPSSLVMLHEAKRVKTGDAEQLADTKVDTERPLPEWTNEISPDLIDLFRGYVEFEP